MSAQDELLTVAEIATILKLNQQTVRNWIDEGKLPSIHVGRRVRVKRLDFDRLIEDEYTGGRAGSSAPTIWDGEVPLPEARPG